MKKNKAMYTLQQDIKIPNIVETKADQTFARIQAEAKTGKEKIIVYDKKIRSPKKKYAVLAMAAVLAVGTVSVYAAYTNWSQGLERGTSGSRDEQQEKSAGKWYGSLLQMHLQQTLASRYRHSRALQIIIIPIYLLR